MALYREPGSVHSELRPVWYGVEPSIPHLLSLPAGIRGGSHRAYCHGDYFPRLSSATARARDGYLFAGIDLPYHPRSDARRVFDGYAELASHFLYQPALGDHWRGVGGDRHGG